MKTSNLLTPTCLKASMCYLVSFCLFSISIDCIYIALANVFWSINNSNWKFDLPWFDLPIGFIINCKLGSSISGHSPISFKCALLCCMLVDPHLTTHHTHISDWLRNYLKYTHNNDIEYCSRTFDLFSHPC